MCYWRRPWHKRKHRVCTLLRTSNSKTLHDLFKISVTLGLAVTSENFQWLSLFKGIFWLNWQFNRHKLWCPPKRLPFALLNTCLLTLTSAKSDLPNKTLIFHDITGLKILKNPWLSRTGKWKSWLSRFFHDPYESCKNPEHKNIKTLRFSLAFAYASATAVLTSS